MTKRTLLMTAFLVVACHGSGSDADEAATNEPAREAETAEPEAAEPEAAEPEAVAQAEAPATMPTEADPHADHDHAHAPGMEHVRQEGEYDPADLVGQPGASIGDLTTCPVGGEVFEVTEDAPYIEHEGQNVYFCCARCIRRFQRNPDEFLGTVAAPAVGGEIVEVTAEGNRFDPPVEKIQVPAGTWICDMGTVHYARSEEGDGRCPICGMHLQQH